MLRTLFIAPFAALFLASAANASPLQTLTLREQPQSKNQLAAEIVEVSGHRSPASVIAQDALYGGIAGLAIGGGVALIAQDGNWGRDLLVGAGVGLLVGAAFGAVDAASMADGKPAIRF
jgi:hypothetical protein